MARRIRRYGACRGCNVGSIRIEENGRVARHTAGFGYVERFPPWHPFRAGPICKGSGALQMEPAKRKAPRGTGRKGR